MGVARMLRPWRRRLQAVLPDLHGHQVTALATASLAMSLAQHCQLTRLAAVTPGPAKLPSSERRWQRLLANRRLDVAAISQRWAKRVLAEPGPMVLTLDETPQGNHLRCMKLSRVVRGRAVPLLWHVYRPDALPMRQDQLVLDLLERAAALTPGDVRPTLLTDRGLAWPAVVDACLAHGWHFVLRVQGQTQVRLAEGPPRAIATLAPGKGSLWRGEAQVFKKAGWRTVNVVAHWPHDVDEPWLLISDLPPTRSLCRRYRQRMRQEQSFRDEKSHGFQWQQSRVREPAHADRLLLIMALAMTWLIELGLRLIKQGRRADLERRDRRTLSVFQLALRYLSRLLTTGRPPP